MPGTILSKFLNLSTNIKKKILSILLFLNQKKYPFYFFLIAVFFVIYAFVLNQIKSYTEIRENPQKKKD